MLIITTLMMMVMLVMLVRGCLIVGGNYKTIKIIMIVFLASYIVIDRRRQMKVMIKAAVDLKRYGGSETSLLHKLWWWSIRLVRYYLIAFRALTQLIHVQGTSSCALRCNTSTPVRMICRG